MACFNYNVNIEQSDLNIADGNIVYVDYYPCPSGSTTQRGYTTAGFYPNDFCNDNNVGTPTIYMLVGGFSAATSSSVVQTFISCDVTPTPTETPTQTPTPTQTSTITPTQTPSVTSTTNQSPTPTTTQTVNYTNPINYTINNTIILCFRYDYRFTLLYRLLWKFYFWFRCRYSNHL